MKKVVDFYYSLASPFVYLGFPEFQDVVNKHGAEVNYRPVALAQTVFPATGGVPLAQRPPQRQAYRLVELRRWSAFKDIPLKQQPAHFPVDDSLAAYMALSAREDGRDIGDFSFQVLRAVWAEEKNIADPEILVTIADEVGFDGNSLLDAAARDEIKTRYETDSQEAVDRGVFGAPFFFYDHEPFWGQDRIAFLDRAMEV